MKFKSYTAGLVTGILIAATVTVSASNLVEVFLQDDVKIVMDGKTLPLPGDMHILNYQNRIYTPARHIAESLGGTIEYDQSTKTLNLTKPEPITKEVEVIKEVVKEVEVVVEKLTYNTLPVKQMQEDVELTVYGIDTILYEPRVSFNLKNDYFRPINFNFTESYIEVKGTRYKAVNRADLINSIEPYTEKESVWVDFESFPKDTKELKLVMGIDYNEYVSGEGNKKRTRTFEMFIKLP